MARRMHLCAKTSPESTGLLEMESATSLTYSSIVIVRTDMTALLGSSERRLHNERELGFAAKTRQVYLPWDESPGLLHRSTP